MHAYACVIDALTLTHMITHRTHTSAQTQTRARVYIYIYIYIVIHRQTKGILRYLFLATAFV